MRDDQKVRSTLDIDADVLEAAKELAARRGTTAGRILSSPASRRRLNGRAPRKRNGVPILARRREAGLITAEVVNRLRDQT